jgi:hypothetical protein
VLVTPALSRLVLPSERLAVALDRPSRLDYAILDELAAALDSDQRLDKQLSSREVLVPTTAHLRMATEFLAGSPPPSLRPRVASLPLGQRDWLAICTTGSITPRRLQRITSSP